MAPQVAYSHTYATSLKTKYASPTVTLVADRESERVLGASVVGSEGTKRIDTVATALHAGLDVTAVQNLDLAYAPPFSPVWDPIATAAKVLARRLGVRPADLRADSEILLAELETSGIPINSSCREEAQP